MANEQLCGTTFSSVLKLLVICFPHYIPCFCVQPLNSNCFVTPTITPNLHTNSSFLVHKNKFVFRSLLIVFPSQQLLTSLIDDHANNRNNLSTEGLEKITSLMKLLKTVYKCSIRFIIIILFCEIRMAFSFPKLLQTSIFFLLLLHLSTGSQLSAMLITRLFSDTSPRENILQQTIWRRMQRFPLLNFDCWRNFSELHYYSERPISWRLLTAYCLCLALMCPLRHGNLFPTFLPSTTTLCFMEAIKVCFIWIDILYPLKVVLQAGAHATADKISLHHQWPGMDRDVREYVKRCCTCTVLPLFILSDRFLILIETYIRFCKIRSIAFKWKLHSNTQTQRARRKRQY